MRRLLSLFLILGIPAAVAGDDWITANHDPARTGRTADSPHAPFRVLWVRQFPAELMTTRVEAIVAGGRVYVGTYAGRLHALDAASGREGWTAQLDGPILHSAACSAGRVHCGTARGSIYAVDAAAGRPIWRTQLGDNGFDTAPLVAGGLVIMGSRAGTLFALDARTGARRWILRVPAPIRTTAASDGRRVYLAAEDMRARACDLATGRLIWTSGPLHGQSLRDYYPVIADGELILRSNPVGPFAERLASDRHALAANAGADDSDWRKLDAFLRSEAAHGKPEKVESEQRAILGGMRNDPDARTFYVLDSATGRESVHVPVLYAAGCQGVGPPPALTPDGRAVVFWRTAYSNWNLGVAPMVGIGVLNPATGRIEPIRHANGSQPPWNTFWGTADETTRFTVGGGTLYINHQGTLSGLDLAAKRLFPIAGNRDTWGGYPGLPWARNEWHGPARGAVAISGDRLFWVTGSRVIAIQGGAAQDGPPPAPAPVLTRTTEPVDQERPLPTVAALRKELLVGWDARTPAPDRRPGDPDTRRLEDEVEKVLRGPWKPLYVQPGLAGREFFFRHSCETFQSLCTAYPLLRPALRQRVAEYLAAQWTAFPPYAARGEYPLSAGKPREWFPVPDSLRKDAGPAPPSVVYLPAAELYIRRIGGTGRLREAWPAIRQAFEQIRASGSKLDSTRPSLWDVRIVAGLAAYARMAREMRDSSAEAALEVAASGILKLIEQARAYDPAAVERPIDGVTEVDRFIGAGNGLFTTVHPHRAKLARLMGITPEIGRCLRRYAGQHMLALLGTIDRMMPGWYLMGEERQVHFGENFLDPPDQALAIFTARVNLGLEKSEELRRYIDMPFCRADLYDIEKRALILEAAG